MPRPLYALSVEAEGAVSEDRVQVIEVGDALVIAVADGAGGVPGSARAAEAVVQGIGGLIERQVPLDDEVTWTRFLTETDLAIDEVGNWGQTTAVVLAATDRWICGASVGDSEGWLATTDTFHSLTTGQNRKPFLGSGMARPVSFRRIHSGGTLIVSTDGLFKCAPAWKVCQIAVSNPPEDACRILLDLARLPNRSLRDDLGVVVCDLRMPESEQDRG